MTQKFISYAKAINIALHEEMRDNKKSVCMGLGINDPKRIFDTTKGLLETFGDERVIEPPTSENALTGIAFGMSLKGYSVCLSHQRFDFAILSFDQIINSIAKWSFMFDKDFKTSLLIRLIIGRGWGQGPTHSQSYHSFLSSIPGINVYYPTSPLSAYRTIKTGMSSGVPSIMIEHRWLHQTQSSETLNVNIEILNNLQIISQGDDLTLFTYGYMVPEAIKAVEYCKKFNINLELIIIESLNNFDLDILFRSIAKTKNIILIEPFYLKCSVIATICTKLFEDIINQNLDIKSIKTISLPFENESTSYFDTKKRYKNWINITKEVESILKKKIPIDFDNKIPHDIPGEWFKGPF